MFTNGEFVVCIFNKLCPYLTLGKTYRVSSSNNISNIIINIRDDSEKIHGYLFFRFKKKIYEVKLSPKQALEIFQQVGNWTHIAQNDYELLNFLCTENSIGSIKKQDDGYTGIHNVKFINKIDIDWAEFSEKIYPPI